MLVASANPAHRGQSVTFFAVVHGGDFLAGTYPGGERVQGEDVTFIIDNRKKIVAPISDGVSEITMRLKPGRHVLSAVYSGAVYATGPAPFGVVIATNGVSGSGAVGLVEHVSRRR